MKKSADGTLFDCIKSLRNVGHYIRNFELSDSDREAIGRLIGLELNQIERGLILRTGQCIRCTRMTGMIGRALEVAK